MFERVHCVHLTQDKQASLALFYLCMQDENMISFLKGGIKVRNSYQIYKYAVLLLLLC